MAVVARQRTSGLRDAALGIGMGVAATLAPAGANAQQVAIAPKPLTPAEQAAASRPIPADVCNIMFDTLTDYLKAKGKDAISPETRRSFKAFFVDAKGDVTCTGNRVIAWTVESDRGIIKAITSRAGGAKKIDVAEQYGVWPADRPVGPQQRSEASAPRVGG